MFNFLREREGVNTPLEDIQMGEQPGLYAANVASRYGMPVGGGVLGLAGLGGAVNALQGGGRAITEEDLLQLQMDNPGLMVRY